MEQVALNRHVRLQSSRHQFAGGEGGVSRRGEESGEAGITAEDCTTKGESRASNVVWAKEEEPSGTWHEGQLFLKAARECGGAAKQAQMLYFPVRPRSRS